MKKFEDYFNEMYNMFSSVGMDNREMQNFSRMLKQLSSRGVVIDSDEKTAARKIITILRPAISRLQAMGLEQNDMLLVIQQVINLMSGINNTGMNQSKIRRSVTSNVTNSDINPS